MRDGSGEVSPKDTKTSDLISEADSNDGHASGWLSNYVVSEMSFLPLFGYSRLESIKRM